jgi:hypothetical protein
MPKRHGNARQYSQKMAPLAGIAVASRDWQKNSLDALGAMYL